MQRLAKCGIVVLGLGIAAACAAPEPAAPARPETWKRLMQAVGSDVDFIAQQLQSPGRGDLRRVASTARTAAAIMARGYGDREQQDVPGFAAMARETESWLLQLGLEAGQGHGDLARELLLQQRHCTQCHRVAEQHGHRIDFEFPVDGR